jgi:hypothetical protein
MSPDAQSESKSWWQTLPGVLTAVAAVITALTGLLVAVHQTGWFDHRNKDQAQTTSRPANPRESETGASHQRAGVKQIEVPANAFVQSEGLKYTLVAGHIEPGGSGRMTLRIGVRMTNDGTAQANFGSGSFRLVVDNGLVAPVNLLDEQVDAKSSKMGDLVFQIPANTNRVGLQMGEVGPGKPAIQIQLPQ